MDNGAIVHKFFSNSSTWSLYGVDVHVDDVDNDGDLDIISAVTFDDTVRWYENNGAANPSLDCKRHSIHADQGFTMFFWRFR